MTATLSLLLTAIADIASTASEAGTITKIIAVLEQIVESGVAEIQAVTPMIKNIIAALTSNTSVTAAQMTQLQTLDAATDAAFEAAATAAGAAADPAGS